MFGKVVSALGALAISLLAACAAAGPARTPDVHDAKRIVTLMPVFADDLCAMGEGDRIAGVSQYTKSARCAQRAPEVANFASVDSEKIIALHPDLVLAIPAQRRLTAALQQAHIPVVFLSDDSYADIFADIDRLGALTHDPGAARAIEQRMHSRTQALRASEHFTKHPSVFVVLQAQPIWTVGPQSYISTLLRLAGARNAVMQLPRVYAEYNAEALIRLQPDAIVAGSDTQLSSLLDREPWRSLRAVQQRRIYILQDPAILERPGPDYNEGLFWLIDHLRSLSR